MGTVLRPEPSRVLLLSPFIDERMVDEAANAVAPRPDPTARRRHRGPHDRRARAQARGAASARAAPDGARLRELRILRRRRPAKTREDEIEQVRALHAKVIALDDGRHATVIVGSNNLTSSGWCGGSTEAFVRLVGDAALCDPLWDWAGAQAQLFDFPEPGTPPPKPPILEQVKDELHAVLFRLEDAGAGAPIAPRNARSAEALELPEGVRMEVARYTTPRDGVPFPSGTSTVDIPRLRDCAANTFRRLHAPPR